MRANEHSQTGRLQKVSIAAGRKVNDLHPISTGLGREHAANHMLYKCVDNGLAVLAKPMNGHLDQATVCHWLCCLSVYGR